MTPSTLQAPLRTGLTRGRVGRRLLGSSLVDSLVGPHGVDRYMELVKPSWSLTEVRAEVNAVQRLTPNSATLTLTPNNNWQGFTAGQFIDLTTEINGVRRTRCYSPAGSQYDDGELELTVTEHPDGLVSRQIVGHAYPGMVVGLSQARGEFILPDRRPRKLLLIGGGSGITPLMSMLRTLSDENYAGEVSLIQYARTPEYLIYADELAELERRHSNFQILRAFTRVEGGELSGHFDRKHLAAVPNHTDAEIFACGPTTLTDAVRSTLADEALSDCLKIENFAPAPMSVPAGLAEGVIKFVNSDRETENSGAALLIQAEDAGLTPESGCRMGICHSCTCRKVSGSVKNINTGEVSTEPNQNIQICISIALGDVELDL